MTTPIPYTDPDTVIEAQRKATEDATRLIVVREFSSRPRIPSAALVATGTFVSAVLLAGTVCVAKVLQLL